MLFFTTLITCLFMRRRDILTAAAYTAYRIGPFLSLASDQPETVLCPAQVGPKPILRSVCARPVGGSSGLHSATHIICNCLLHKFNALVDASYSQIWCCMFGISYRGSHYRLLTVGCCGRFGRGASLYRHRSQMFGRL